MLTMSRLASHVLFGLMIGSLYLGIGNEAKSAYNNAAQLFFAVMFLLFGALMSTILTCKSKRGERLNPLFLHVGHWSNGLSCTVLIFLSRKEERNLEHKA